MSDESIFAEALAIPNPGTREEYLDEACAGNPELRQEIEALLAAHSNESPLDRPLQMEDETVIRDSTARVGAVIADRYKLLEQIGEGGMGTVWVAEQFEPVRRKVALKLIKAGMDSKSVLARFEAERQALALMDHPHIAKVLDGGLTESGRPYFVMEYVKGVPITEYCDAARLSVTERLDLFLQVCSAVQHAHQKGIIHRDLKPSNVLVAPYDDKPVPKVIDFGLAKAMNQSLTDRTLHTAHEIVLGTPLYMSPEQAQLNNLDVDTRTDIYALGVLLYELLTGTTPFEKESFKTAAWDEVRRILREVDPPRPSLRLSSTQTLPSVAACRHTEPVKLTQLVRGDLDWIVMKALEKDRKRRYETASGLARDIERYLSDELVEARPPSTSYRLRKYIRRNRGQVIGGGLVLATLLIGILITTFLLIRVERLRQTAEVERQRAEAEAASATQSREEATGAAEEADLERDKAERERREAQSQREIAERQRDVAQAERRAAQRNLATSQFLLARIANSDGDTASALAWAHQAYRNTTPDESRRASARNLIGAWGGDLMHTLVHRSGVHTVAISADGRKLVTGYYNSRAQVWDLTTGKPQGDPLDHAGDIVSAQVSADGGFAVIGDWRGAKVWDLETGQLRFPALEHEVREDTVVGPVLSPDDRVIVTRSPFTGIRLWDAATGKPLSESLDLGKYVSRMKFTPDSRRVAAVGGGVARVWDVATAQPIGEPFTEVTGLAFHPTEPIVAVSRSDGNLLIRDLDSGDQITELTHEHPLRAVEFNAAGNSLLTRDDENAYLWSDALNPERTQRTLLHGRSLFTATFSSSGGWILTASPLSLQIWKEDSETPIWNRSIPRNFTRFDSDRIKSATFSPDGRSLLTRTEDNTVEVIAVANGQKLRELNVVEAVFSPDGKQLFAGSRDGWVRVRSVDAGDRRRLPDAKSVVASGSASALSSDGKFIFVVGREESHIYRTDTWEQVGKPLKGLYHDWKDAVSGAAFSPDNRILVSSMSLRGDGPPPYFKHSSKITFWDVETSEPIGEPIARQRMGPGVAFDLSGNYVCIGKVLFDVRTRSEMTISPDHIPAGHQAVSQLLGIVDSNSPPLWDEELNRPATVKLPLDSAKQIRLSNDGRQLLVVGADGTARSYDATTGSPSGPAFQPEGNLTDMTRDGSYAFFASWISSQLWDTRTGQPIGDPISARGNLRVAFSPDGTILAMHENFSAELIDCATGMRLGPPMELRSNQISRPIFSPDGKRLYVPSAELTVWKTPVSAADEPQRLQLSIEVRTGLEVDENSTTRKLNQATWLERKQRLEELGGPCDVRN